MSTIRQALEAAREQVPQTNPDGSHNHLLIGVLSAALAEYDVLAAEVERLKAVIRTMARRCERCDLEGHCVESLLFKIDSIGDDLRAALESEATT